MRALEKTTPYKIVKIYTIETVYSQDYTVNAEYAICCLQCYQRWNWTLDLELCIILAYA